MAQLRARVCFLSGHRPSDASHLSSVDPRLRYYRWHRVVAQAACARDSSSAQLLITHFPQLSLPGLS